MLFSKPQTSVAIGKRSHAGGTIDIEVSVLKGRYIRSPHQIRLKKLSFFVVLRLDKEDERISETKERSDDQNNFVWDQSFVFPAKLSSRLEVKVYCKHVHLREDHVIGEASLDLFKTGMNANFEVAMHDREGPAGYLTMCLKVAVQVISTLPTATHDLKSLHSFNQMAQIIESLSTEELQKISPAWRRLFKCLDAILPIAVRVADLDSRAKFAVGALAFAIKIVINQMSRDEKIEKLIEIIGDVLAYVSDVNPIQKILSFKSTLDRLLTQTAECAYFIGQYQKLPFAARAAMSTVTDVDSILANFERAFGDLKIDLVLTAALQTAVVSYRILETVENIETVTYINYLQPLRNVTWDSNRTCLRGTRETVVNDVVRWASLSIESHGTQSCQIYVLQGPSGCGKSAIAHRIAQVFDQQKRLGAAVFLGSQTEGNITSRAISRTIAFHLASYDKPIGQRMALKIKNNVPLAEADIRRQFYDLILPSMEGLSFVGPVLIVLDGLENYTSPAEQLEVLKVLADHFTHLPSNFRLLLTFCPTSSTYDLVQSMPTSIIRKIGFDDDENILEERQYMVECVHHLFSKKPQLSDTYSLDDLCDQFSRRAMGMRFWVSTLIQSLLSCTEGSEFAILDALTYTKFPESLEETMDCLYRVIFLPYPIQVISRLFQLLLQSTKPLPRPLLLLSSEWITKHHHILDTMQKCGLVIEKRRDKDDNPLFGVHPSLEDFLTNNRRCQGTGLYMDREASTSYVAELCLHHMNQFLKHNICNLDNVMILNEEIPEKQSRISLYIGDILQYACTHWIVLLEEIDFIECCEVPSGIRQNLEIFLLRRLLNWIECMSLLGLVDRISLLLYQLATWLKKYASIFRDARYYTMTTDAIDFMHAFSPIISKAALQTYISALPLMPADSLLFRQYSLETYFARSNLKSSVISTWRCVPKRTLVVPTSPPPNQYAYNGDYIVIAGRKGIELVNIDSHKRFLKDKIIDCVSWSPNGRHIAIAESTGFIGLWNHTTKEYNDILLDVDTFRSSKLLGWAHITHSANGKIIMATEKAAQHDSIRWIYVWDSTNRRLIQQLKLSIFSLEAKGRIALSSDGSQIALATKIGIQIVDIHTGEGIGEPIPVCHDNSMEIGQVYEFIWSSNGQFIAVIYHEKMIQLCSLGDGKFVELERDSNPLCLAFSPDCSSLASIHRSPTGNELCVWDSSNGDLIYEQKIYSSPYCYSVEFRHDDRGHQTISISVEAPTDLLHITYVRDSPVYMHHRRSADSEHLDNGTALVSQNIPTIQFSYDDHECGATPLGRRNDYATHVNSDGWVCNKRGEREMWIPYPRYELSALLAWSDGVSTALKVKNPETKEVVLKFVIKSTSQELRWWWKGGMR